MKNLFKRENIFILLSIILLFYYFNQSLNTLTHIYDGGHHGSILVEALDLFNGKIPYKEIFLQYGFLNTFINSVFLVIFDNNILGIYIATSLFYYLSILFLALIVKSLSSIYGFFLTVLVFLFNHPLPEYPWPNYSAFFFLIMSVYFFNVKKKSLFLSGLFMGLSCLARENFYYFIVPTLLFINLIIFLNKKKFDYNISLMFGFFIPIIIFFIYLFSLNVFDTWIEYQKLPFKYLDGYEVSFFELLYKFSVFFLLEVPFKIGTNPQYFLILIVFLFNFFFLFKQFFFEKTKNIKLIYISCLCLSSIVVSINYEIFRLYTSVIIGLPIIAYFIVNFKNNDNKFISLFLIMFISIYSIYFYPKGNVKFFNNINYKNSINSEEFIFFKDQKWERDKWDVLKSISLIDKEIYQKCDLNYILNLTPNAFILPISKFDKIQLSPVFNEHLGREFAIALQNDFKKIVNKELNDQNIYIYSMENNIKILNNELNNYIILKSIDVKGYKGSKIRVMVPKKCYSKLQI